MIYRVVRFAIPCLVIGVALAGGCTTPPDNGYDGAGRIQMLPGFADDGSTLEVDGGEGGEVDGEAPGTMAGLCLPGGVVCRRDSQCCAPGCTAKDGGQGYCSVNATHGTNICATNGFSCETHEDCCDFYCSPSGVCGDTPAPMCVPGGVMCTDTNQCCGAASEDASVTSIDGGIVCMEGACSGHNFTNQKAPLCVPLGVFCGPTETCCAGQCILNGSLQYVCVIPSP